MPPERRDTYELINNFLGNIGLANGASESRIADLLFQKKETENQKDGESQHPCMRGDIVCLARVDGCFVSHIIPPHLKESISVEQISTLANTCHARAFSHKHLHNS
jgi:hypothetical protein